MALVMQALQEKIRRLFSYLEADYGFSLTHFETDSAAATNFTARYAGEHIYILIVRTQGRVEVRFSTEGTHWSDKEALLERMGIDRSRHPITDLGFWTGYTLEVQATDLRQHMDFILTHLLGR